jgi:hypothetical protein
MQPWILLFALALWAFLALATTTRHSHGSLHAKFHQASKRADKVPLRILPLGASLTWGLLSTSNNRYRKPLRDQLVERPPGAKVLPGKWVYDVKCDLDNNVKDFRARWVACGNFQKDFDDNIKTYAPVIVDVFVKMFLTKVVRQGKEVVQFNMVTAYLNALIQQKQVFVKQPTGFKKAGSLDLVSMLLRAIYGLRELANLWNKIF